MRRSVTIKGGVFVGPRGGSPRLTERTYIRMFNRFDRVIWASGDAEVPATITVSWEAPAPKRRKAKGGKRA